MIQSLLYKCESRTSGPRRRKHLMILHPISFILLSKAPKLLSCALHKFTADMFHQVPLGSVCTAPNVAGAPLISPTFSHPDSEALPVRNIIPKPPTMWGSTANNRGDSRLCDYSQPVMNARPAVSPKSSCVLVRLTGFYNNLKLGKQTPPSSQKLSVETKKVSLLTFSRPLRVLLIR